MDSPAPFAAFDPLVIPTLDPDEVAAAVKSGSVIGIVDAIALKLPPGELAARAAIRGLRDSSPAIRAANHLVSIFKNGEGIDHRVALGEVAGVLTPVEVIYEALAYAGWWISGNPGDLIWHPQQPGRKKRVFRP